MEALKTGTATNQWSIKCGDCSKNVLNQHVLKVHMARAHNTSVSSITNITTCKLCHLSFETRQQGQSHIYIVHGKHKDEMEALRLKSKLRSAGSALKIS